jgi:hypothetical protein
MSGLAATAAVAGTGFEWLTLQGEDTSLLSRRVSVAFLLQRRSPGVGGLPAKPSPTISHGNS